MIMKKKIRWVFVSDAGTIPIAEWIVETPVGTTDAELEGRLTGANGNLIPMILGDVAADTPAYITLRRDPLGLLVVAEIAAEQPC
jgi:hypothetical protein